MPADAMGEALDIEAGGRDEEPLIDGAAIFEFGPVDDPDQGLDVVEPGLPRIIPVGLDPVDDG